MSRFHVVLPTRAGEPVVLPEFVTDVRPRGRETDHLQVGKAAELAGWDGVLVPFDPDGRESLVLAAGLLRASRRIGVTAEIHPGIGTPVYAAKLSASLQRYTGARLGWKVAVELDRRVARAQGDDLEGAARYRRAAEFLTVARGVWEGEGYSFEGEFFHVLDGGLPGSRVPRPFPRVLLSGTSEEALTLSARHADVHVLETGDDPGLVPEGVVAAVRLRVPPDATDRGIADEIRYHRDSGFEEFVVELHAPVEDAYRVGQRVLPLLTKETAGVG